MNEHEIERIAAATHALRPDWPNQSLRTLIRNKLGSRPRRDVAVALTWIACDPATSTPARVLETGPWWRAAAADDQSTGTAPRPPKVGTACATCGREATPTCCDQPTTRPARADKCPPTEDWAKTRAALRGERSEG